MIFRTASGNKFVKDFKEHRFFPVLKDGQYQFIKMTDKPTLANGYTAGFTMPMLNSAVVTDTFKDLNSAVSRWQIQFGVKYLF